MKELATQDSSPRNALTNLPGESQVLILGQQRLVHLVQLSQHVLNRGQPAAVLLLRQRARLLDVALRPALQAGHNKGVFSAVSGAEWKGKPFPALRSACAATF